jgi:hypothetical protein
LRPVTWGPSAPLEACKAATSGMGEREDSGLEGGELGIDLEFCLAIGIFEAIGGGLGSGSGWEVDLAWLPVAKVGILGAQ